MKKRADVLLSERGLAESREKARRMILAGEVFVGDRRVGKPSEPVADDVELRVRAKETAYASRGGDKLAGALDDLGVDPAGRIALDVGASTGGFTDCLLQRGASRVYAVDVGYGQLDWRLRNDPRVVVHERENVRLWRTSPLPEPVDLVTIDVSFISLRHVLPAATLAARPGARLLPMVKPQFEVGRADVGKGGVVRSPELQRKAVDAVAAAARELGLLVEGEAESRLRGPRGNREFFLSLRMPESSAMEEGGE